MIEVGSRAVRLVVADVSLGGIIQQVGADSAQTRLAAVLRDSDSETTLRNQLGSIREHIFRFEKRASQLGARSTMVVGTEAIRRASAAHADIVRSTIPDIVVLRKKTEAIGSLAAGFLSVPGGAAKGQSLLVIDQGSGSLELAAGARGNSHVDLVMYKSYGLGTEAIAGKLHEVGNDVAGLRPWVAQRVKRWKIELASSRLDTVLMGSAVTKCAFVAFRRPGERYRPAAVNGRLLTVDSVDGLIQAAAQQPKAVRALIDPEDPESGEFETVIGGLVGLSSLLRKLSIERFIVSGLGTRHGLVWLIAASPVEKIPSELRPAVGELMRRSTRRRDHRD